MNTSSLLTESGRNKSLKDSKTNKEIVRHSTSIPPGFFLAVAGGAVAVALGLAMTKKQKGWANFVGQWVPTILLLGVYDKIARTHPKEQEDNKSLLH